VVQRVSKLCGVVPAEERRQPPIRAGADAGRARVAATDASHNHCNAHKLTPTSRYATPGVFHRAQQHPFVANVEPKMHEKVLKAVIRRCKVAAAERDAEQARLLQQIAASEAPVEPAPEAVADLRSASAPPPLTEVGAGAGTALPRGSYSGLTLRRARALPLVQIPSTAQHAVGGRPGPAPAVQRDDGSGGRPRHDHGRLSP